MNEKLVLVRIERDYWDDEGTRHRAGTQVQVPVEAAMDGIETGALSRVKTPVADVKKVGK